MTYSWMLTPWIGDVEHADHGTDALTESLDQYSEKPRFQVFLAALMDQVQSLEDLAIDLLALRSVYTAVGDQLDTLGEIVGLERGELLDEPYRVFLLGKIYANRADGQAPQIYELLSIIGGVGTYVHDHEGAGLTVYSAMILWPEPTHALLELMLPAGVNWHFEFNEVDTDRAFTFSDTIDAEGSSTGQSMTLGPFGDPTSIGGYIAGSLVGGE